MATKEQVLDVLKDIEDPELRKSIVELDMVKNIAICDDIVDIKINLTIQGCPLQSVIQQEVNEKLRQKLPEIKQVNVQFGAMNDQERVAVAQKMRGGGAGAEGGMGPGGVYKRNPFADPNSPTRLITVASGKGGVGKSTTTVNLAVALAKLGFHVGIMDCDIYGFSVPRMLGNMGRPVPIQEDMLLPLQAHGVRFISAGSFVDEDTPIIWRGPMLGKMLDNFLNEVFWGELDYLLLDLPPGTGDVALSLSQMLPGADMVIVTTPQAAASQVAQRVGKMAEKTQQKVIGVIENMSYFVCPNCSTPHEIFGKGGAEAVAARLGTELLGKIPLTADLRLGGDVGDPVVVAHPDDPAAKAFAQVAAELARVAPPKRPVATR